MLTTKAGLVKVVTENKRATIFINYVNLLMDLQIKRGLGIKIKHSPPTDCSLLRKI
jgi:hypothetical protein